MTVLAARQGVLPQKNLVTRACILPRPGEEILWHQNSLRLSGTLVGHTPEGQPRVICSEYGVEMTLSSYEITRLAEPDVRLGPNWTRLAQCGVAVRLTDEEQAGFDGLLNRSFPQGTRQLHLLQEVWERGF